MSKFSNIVFLLISSLFFSFSSQAVEFEIDGEWIYRSLHNKTDINLDFNDLAFGKGTLVLKLDNHKVSGSLGGPGWNLVLKGSYNADEIRFQGTGEIGGELWVYDYKGVLIMPWPHEVNQLPTIVGSVIRTKAHSEGKSPAGYVASFYAVKSN